MNNEPMNDCIQDKTTSHVDNGKRIAVVGMFDGLHIGHRFLLGQLKAEGEKRNLKPLVITFSNHPLEIIAPDKAPALLSLGKEKADMLQREGFETELLYFNKALRQTSAADFLKRLKYEFGANTLMLGFNNRFGHDAPQNPNDYRLLGKDCGIEIIQAKELEMPGTKISSSTIRSFLSNGLVEKAATLLGRQYSISGTVEHGKQIGRMLGFPTANVNADPRRLIPANGVYAAEAELPNGTRRQAIVNIGHRPTIESNGNTTPLSIEAYLIDFNDNIYGNTLTLQFHFRLRDEMTFPSFEALKSQINADKEEALRLLPKPMRRH